MMETMEEKFLRARQEREDERATKTRDASEVTVLRRQFDDQAVHLRRDFDAKIAAGLVDDAQLLVNRFRALVQDASNNVSLTAYDRARANATLSRLQKSVDECKSGATTIKKFRFSRARPQPSASGAEAAPLVSSSTQQGDEGISSGFDTVYGPATDTTLFVGHAKAVFVKECTGCTLLAVPIAGSVFISNCRDCSIYVACHQLRMKDCHNVSVYVWCSSTPIIERCDGMQFGSYKHWKGLLKSVVGGASYDTHEQWVSEVGDIHDLQRTALTYTTVDDFQWLRKTASPHWRVLETEEAKDNHTVFPSA